MKKLVFLLFTVGCFYVSHGQLNTSFTNLYTQTGTNHKITWNNTSSESYRIINEGIAVAEPADQLLNFQYRNTIGFLQYINVLSLRQTNVGIGTTAPLQKLHVNGDSYFDGWVGIGVSTPTSSLDVRADENPSVRIKSNDNGSWVDLGVSNCSSCYSGLSTDGDVVIRAKPYTNDLILANQGTGNFILGNGDTGSEQRRLVIVPNGDVGIGIGSATPQEKLHVGGNITWGSSGNSKLSMDQGGSLQLKGENQNSTPYIDFQNNPSGSFDARLILNGDNALVLNGANFGIGTNNPDEKLTVKGKIHSEEVKVDLNVPADYVFQKYYTGTSSLKSDYKMPSLKEVEIFVKKNHHLPDIPSAATIQEKGLQLGEMANLLLQKIEELTLYTIEQQKRIKALENQLSK